MGVFSLTPQGTLRWATPEQYRRQNVVWGDIVFGPNGSEQQLYFYANSHTRAVRLSDGASIFESAGNSQPVVSPYDGTVHQGARAYSPQGSLLWYYEPVWFPSKPDVGADGIHFVINVSSRLYALYPNGMEKYNVPLGPGSYDRPAISPDGSALMATTINTDGTGAIGLIRLNPTNGAELWRTVLPGEFGLNNLFTTKFTFSADSQTVYINSEFFGNSNANVAYLNAIDCRPAGTPTPTPTPSPTPRWTRVTLHSEQ